MALCGTLWHFVAQVGLKWTPAVEVSRTTPDSRCHLCHPCPQHTCKYRKFKLWRLPDLPGAGSGTFWCEKVKDVNASLVELNLDL